MLARVSSLERLFPERGTQGLSPNSSRLSRQRPQDWLGNDKGPAKPCQGPAQGGEKCLSAGPRRTLCLRAGLRAVPEARGAEGELT